MSDVVKEIEMSMEITKKKIDIQDCLNRLSKNTDFKKFILEGFCKDHALGLIAKKVSPNFQDDMNKSYIEGQLSAVGHLQLYMRFVQQEGEMAKESLKAAEEEKSRALEEI